MYIRCGTSWLRLKNRQYFFEHVCEFVSNLQLFSRENQLNRKPVETQHGHEMLASLSRVSSVMFPLTPLAKTHI